MPKKKPIMCYSEDMVGLWLYVLLEGRYHCVSDRPIVSPEDKVLIRATLPNHEKQLRAWLEERVVPVASIN